MDSIDHLVMVMLLFKQLTGVAPGVGAMLCHAAKVLLGISALRYIDDFFAIDYPECVDHVMTCFARMVRLVRMSSRQKSWLVARVIRQVV